MQKKLKNRMPVFFEQADDKMFRILDIEVHDITAYAEENIKPAEENNYVASDTLIERFESVQRLKESVFGGQEIQAGWCFGGRRQMAALEWHESSEAVIACTNMVLLLGRKEDIENGQYNSSKLQALFLKAGSAVEIFPGTLHFAPLPAGDRFVASIVLPKGTNLPIPDGEQNGMKTANNKWLLVHPQGRSIIKARTDGIIVGENYKV